MISAIRGQKKRFAARHVSSRCFCACVCVCLLTELAGDEGKFTATAHLPYTVLESRN